MSAKSAYFDAAELQSLSTKRADEADMERNRAVGVGRFNSWGVPESYVDNLNPAAAVFNRIERNPGLALGSNKKIYPG